MYVAPFLKSFNTNKSKRTKSQLKKQTPSFSFDPLDSGFWKSVEESLQVSIFFGKRQAEILLNDNSKSGQSFELGKSVFHFYMISFLGFARTFLCVSESDFLNFS